MPAELPLLFSAKWRRMMARIGVIPTAIPIAVDPKTVLPKQIWCDDSKGVGHVQA